MTPEEIKQLADELRAQRDKALAGAIAKFGLPLVYFAIGFVVGVVFSGAVKAIL